MGEGLERISRISRREPSPFELEVSPRDIGCNSFQARVTVNGVVALRYSYRLNLDLTPHIVIRHTIITNTKAFARIFGWRNFLHHEADILKRLFLENEAEILKIASNAVHVEAAARAGQFTRISNALAIEHALTIKPYVDGVLERRLMSFELCGEAGAFAPYHWTVAADKKRETLPKNLFD